ncbi:hypothetical protein AVEN_188836-1, partial [Araneus ventricosus]
MVKLPPFFPFIINRTLVDSTHLPREWSTSFWEGLGVFVTTARPIQESPKMIGMAQDVQMTGMA